MSSIFVTKQKASSGINRLFGATQEEDVFLQFVPGTVVDVVTSYESAAYDNPRDINCIIGKSHLMSSKDIQYKSVTETKYYPLLRGMVDVPAKGDPVLLCTFGGVNYYLGPINTLNSPNWNLDHLNIPEVDISDGKKDKISDIDKYGMSKNFKKIPISRLQKMYNETLDTNQLAIKDIVGDVIIEGRYGNSIRLGSRDVNPYTIISNGRDAFNSVESLTDGSTLGLFNKGTLRNYFLFDSIQTTESQKGLAPIVEDLPFTLASDSIDNPLRLIGNNSYNYEYEMPQAILNSDRITINSKQDSIFLSSFQHIYIGAGNSCTIKTTRETVIDSSNVYLGEQAKEQTQPMVLGNHLLEVFDTLLSLLIDSRALVQGVPVKLTDPIGVPLEEKFKAVQREVSKILSEYHFIEDNGQKA